MSLTERSNDRLLFLLETVEKEGRHLIGTTARLFAETVDTAWVKRLEDQPELAERTDAFTTHFGRMQDTMGDKLQTRHDPMTDRSITSKHTEFFALASMR
ncbi:MAG: hypothetical protein WBN85_11000 [Candidatus Macondimonas sp.]